MGNRMSRRFTALLLPIILVALSIGVAIGFSDVFKNKEVLADGDEYVLTEQDPVEVTFNSDLWYIECTFTPSQTGYYKFTFDHSDDYKVYKSLYFGYNWMAQTSKSSLSYKLSAGETYKLEISVWDSGNFPFTVSVAQFSPAATGACGDSATWSFDQTTGKLTVSGTTEMYGFSNYEDEADPLPPWQLFKNEIKSVVIENGVKSVGSYAFSSCKALETVTIGKDVQSLGYYSFQSCENLKIVSFASGASLKTIGACAFSYCKILESFPIPSTVTSIGNNAFSSCYKLSGIVLPDGIKELGQAVFDGCDSLTEIVIPNGITYIDVAMFSGCDNLAKVTIPETVTKIGNKVFADCVSLKTITLPSGLEGIEYSLFQNCSSLQSIDIPDGVEYIGNDAFNGCSSLKSVVIPKGVTVILDGTFCNCKSLTSISIPDTVTSIGGYAFYDCEILSDIVLPSDLKTIGEGAFSGCDSITSVSFGKKLTSIGMDAFSGCDGLQEIVIPRNVETIGYRAFNYCHALKKVTIEGGYLDGDTFEYDENLETVILGDAVVNIGKEAFLECRKLKSVFISGSVDAIGMNAFEECNSLEDLTIEEGVKSIGMYAFVNCEKLKTLIIPASITSIDSAAFNGCSGITDVYCYADPNKLVWKGANNDFIPYMMTSNPSGLTICHVFDSQLDTFNTKFGIKYATNMNNAVNVTFKGDLSDTIGMGQNLGEHLYGYSLSLEGDIGVKFYMDLSGANLSEDAYVEFTVPTGKTSVTRRVYVQAKAGENRAVAETVTEGGKTYYVFKCQVAAKDISSTIRAQMIDGDRSGERYAYTVKSYAEYLLAHKGDNEEYAKAAPLVNALLRYGTWTQWYFLNGHLDYTYFDDATVGAVTAADIKAEMTEPVVNIGSLSGVEFEGATLSFKSETTLSLYFTSNAKLSFSCNKNKVIETAKVGDYQVVRIRGIAAADIDEVYTVTISCNGKQGTIQYSAMNYIYNAVNGYHDDTLQYTVKALFLYHKEAEEFLKWRNGQ